MKNDGIKKLSISINGHLWGEVEMRNDGSGLVIWFAHPAEAFITRVEVVDDARVVNITVKQGEDGQP